MEVASCALRMAAGNYKSAAPLMLSNMQQRRRVTAEMKKGKATFVTTASSAAAATHAPTHKRQTVKVSQQPVHIKATEFRERVALCDANGSFLYEDIVRRSSDLAEGIANILTPDHSFKQRKIGFMCPNGAGSVIVPWACWMGGHIAVPLDKDSKEEDLEFCINEAQCDLIVAAKSNIDQVNEICKRSNKRVAYLDDTWTANPISEVDSKRSSSVKFHTANNTGALILFSSSSSSGKRQMVPFSHSQLNAQMDSIALGWDLTEKCSVLHALPLTNLYGLVTALMTPLSVGGKVVMLPQFDTIKVWSHLLGIGVNTPQPLPKVNMFLSVPSQYTKLLDRHKLLFRDRKTKDYVKANCKKRVRAMTSSYGHLAGETKEEWFHATGHNIINCYTSVRTGTTLSGEIENAAAGVEFSKSDGMRALPGVSTRVIDGYRNGKKTERGHLVIQGPGSSNEIATGDDVTITSQGTIQLL